MARNLFEATASDEGMVIRRTWIPPYWQSSLAGFLVSALALAVREAGSVYTFVVFVAFVVLPFSHWIFFSKYPSVVFIGSGVVAAEYRRLFVANTRVEVTSEVNPRIEARSHARDRKQTTATGIVEVMSFVCPPIVLYEELAPTRFEAFVRAQKFAEAAADVSGFTLATDPTSELHRHQE